MGFPKLPENPKRASSLILSIIPTMPNCMIWSDIHTPGPIFPTTGCLRDGSYSLELQTLHIICNLSSPGQISVLTPFPWWARITRRKLQSAQNCGASHVQVWVKSCGKLLSVLWCLNEILSPQGLKLMRWKQESSKLSYLPGPPAAFHVLVLLKFDFLSPRPSPFHHLCFSW